MPSLAKSVEVTLSGWNALLHPWNKLNIIEIFFHQKRWINNIWKHEWYQFHTRLKRATALQQGPSSTGENIQDSSTLGSTSWHERTALWYLKYTTHKTSVKSAQGVKVKKDPVCRWKASFTHANTALAASQPFPRHVQARIVLGTLISALKLLILCQPAFSKWKLAHLRSSSSGDSFIRSSRFSPSRSKAASARRKILVRGRKEFSRDKPGQQN